MTEVFLVGGARTPIGRFGGGLSGVRADDLAGQVVAETVRRAGVDGGAVDEVVLGAANQAGEDNRNVARMAVLLAGLPNAVPGLTVNRLCGSGLTAVATAAALVRSGEADLVIAGGVESMTRAPWVMAKPAAAWAKPGELVDSTLGWRFVNARMKALDDGRATMGLGETAEEVAALHGITREECDAFALLSHQNAVRAWKDGLFASEVTSVETPAGEVSEDEGPRPDCNLERLSALRPVFRKDGVVTAGNSSPLNDGAAAVIVASGAAVDKLGLSPRARVVASTSAGVAPHLMGLGPVPATEKLFARTGWDADSLDAIELNEAFASQALACQRLLDLDPARINSDGGAIALGHPLGASGTRILITLLGRLERSGGRRGLASMCVGVGQGVALAVERI